MPKIRIDEDFDRDDDDGEDLEKGELSFMDDDDDAENNPSPDLEAEDEGEEGEAEEEIAEEEEHEEAVTAEQEEDGDGEDDDDLSAYSKSVRKRIQRERRLKEEARQQLAEARAELERRRREDRQSKIDGELDAAYQELEDARADADLRKEADAMSKLTRLKAERDSLGESSAAPKQGSGDGPSPAYAAWLKRNPWFTKPENAAQYHATLAIARKLKDQGLNDETADFYTRLDKELPKHIKVPREGKPPPPKPSTIGRRPERSAGSSPRRVVVTPQIKKEMRSFGLDPKNPEHMKAYLSGGSNA